MAEGENKSQNIYRSFLSILNSSFYAVIQCLTFIHSTNFLKINFRQKHWCEREMFISCLPHAPRPGIGPTTWVCAPTEDRTLGPLVYGMMLLPTEPRQPGLNQEIFNDTYSMSDTVPVLEEPLIHPDTITIIVTTERWWEYRNRKAWVSLGETERLCREVPHCC